LLSDQRFDAILLQIPFLSSDNLHACKVGAWDEKERKRIAKKKKEHKGSEPFNEVAKPFDDKWNCLHFLTFMYLGFPAGRAHCIKLFKLTPGTDPVRKKVINENWCDTL
jgi:hypothetical protein